MGRDGDTVRYSRRKRVQDNNGDAGWRPAEQAPPNDNGISGNGNSNGNSTVNGKRHRDADGGRARARRRRRRKARTTRVGALALGLACVGSLAVVWLGVGGPGQRSQNQGQDTDTMALNYERIGRDVIRSFPDGDAPLTEEQEQEVLNTARASLDAFPVSINAPGAQWETIRHPGTEAMEFTGERPLRAHGRGKPRDDRAAVLAGVLSRKVLRGGDHGAPTGDGTGAAGVAEGDLRVPAMWDPPPYGLIADERERRGGDISPPKDDQPRDGVRRYLGDFGTRLMTPREARSIGSRLPADGAGTRLETIFVAIASYRDWQCAATVEGIYARAVHPERVRVAVVDQIRVGEDAPCSVPPGGSCEEKPDQATCRYRTQIDYLLLDAQDSVGPVFARHLGNRLYRGEYFAMQSDAHVAFVRGWDTEIIEQWHSARNEMAILSNYLSGTGDHIDLETGKRTSNSRPIMCKSDYEGSGAGKHLRHGQQPEGTPYIHDMPTLNPFWAAGFSFGRGHFVVNIPYDQHLPWIFQGEEISIGLRGFSYGYDYYSAERSVCYHFYGRTGVPMFWENSRSYGRSGVPGMNRLNAIIHMTDPKKDADALPWLHADQVKYGLGKVRDVQLFFDIFGIHVETQTVEQHLCRFVGKPMQKEFIPFLRRDEMGIDYDKITYRYVDK